jgi:hypothetical protein
MHTLEHQTLECHTLWTWQKEVESQKKIESSKRKNKHNFIKILKQTWVQISSKNLNLQTTQCDTKLWWNSRKNKKMGIVKNN